MFKITVASALVGLAAAECDGSPCQTLAVSTPGRLEDEHTMEADPVLAVNTFTAVDKCTQFYILSHIHFSIHRHIHFSIHISNQSLDFYWLSEIASCILRNSI